ncbi:MAG: zinc-finger domain-containing protein [Burkholderiales bacterium]
MTATTTASPPAGKARHIEVTADDLPLHCPTPSMPLWSAHPRVFLPIEKTGEVLCPYCGTRYTLKGGAQASH